MTKVSVWYCKKDDLEYEWIGDEPKEVLCKVCGQKMEKVTEYEE